MSLRYIMEVIARPSDRSADEGFRGERPWKVNVTSDTEEEARREVVHRAYHNRLIVSQFLTVESQELP